MKRVLAAVVLSMALAVAAQAATYTFSFDSLANSASTATIQAYMDNRVDPSTAGDVTLTVWDNGNLVDNGSQLRDYDGDKWLKADKGGDNLEGVMIRFNTVQIQSLSFQWAVANNEFVVEADGAQVWTSGFYGGNARGSQSLTLDLPASTLKFHDDGGWVGLDQLEVTTADGGSPAVPAPGALLLAGLGSGLVGWIRRRRAL